MHLPYIPLDRETTKCAFDVPGKVVASQKRLLFIKTSIAMMWMR